MIDANALLRRWIAEGLGTERVSAPVLPEWRPETFDGFNPKDGPWIVISRRGGLAHSEADLFMPSVQIRVWADAEQFPVASARSIEVFNLIHQQTSKDFDQDGYVISCLQEGADQDVVDPETGYATVLSFYGLKCTSNDFRS